MSTFKKIAIVGTGLIGGSLALAIKKNKIAKAVVGVSRHKKSLLLAKKKGAIDNGSQDINIIKDADLVILATPVNVILKSAAKISKIVNKDCIVTDVGSTKGKIVSVLEKKFPNFCGSHPLAGSEKRGVTNAKAELFKDSLCILTPTGKTKKAALARLKSFWSKIGARTVDLPPDKHDRILAFVSHLPHIAAFSLISAVPKDFLKFASGGLKDTTRVAASDSELWADIFLSNQKNVLKSVEALEAKISEIRSALSKKDSNRLRQILKASKAKREYLG